MCRDGSHRSPEITMIHVTMMCDNVKDKSEEAHGQYDTHPRQGVTTCVEMVAIDLLKCER